LGAHSKPVIVLDPFGHYAGLWTYLESLRDKGFVTRGALSCLHCTTDVDSAFAIIEG
jgi:predicted Rossmann-fold nucleotide-binding protein